MISCIILAGGKSKRIIEEEAKKDKGKKTKKAKKAEPTTKPITTSKAFIKLNKRPLVLHVFDTVKRFFPEVIVVVKTKKQQTEMEKLIKGSNVAVVADKSKSFSPVIGIKAALPYATGESVFVVGCDMPFVNGVTIFRLMNKMKKGIDCVVPSKLSEGKRRYEPLCAIYSKGVFRSSKDDESLHDIIDRSKKLLVPMYDDSVFFNINTREDLKLAEKMLEGVKPGKK